MAAPVVLPCICNVAAGAIICCQQLLREGFVVNDRQQEPLPGCKQVLLIVVNLW